MNRLEERILRDGVVKEGNVLKVGGFLNHVIDVDLMDWMGQEFKRRFEGLQVDKILTIESSGIAIATMAGHYFHVPVLYAKKNPRIVTMDDDKYVADAFSFTHKVTNHVIVTKTYLNPGEKILVIDDFLANGAALTALSSIIEQAGAELVGVGIAVEKGMQGAGDRFRANGMRIESLALIDEMDAETNTIKFR